MERTPTHHDAELVLRLYDLRRDPVMREQRVKMTREFWPMQASDVTDLLNPSHMYNVAYRQVTTYWEMAYTFCRHGTLDPNMLLESSAEGLFIYARFEPHLAALRGAGAPRAFVNTEWIATQTEIGRSIMEFQRARVAKLTAQRAAK